MKQISDKKYVSLMKQWKYWHKRYNSLVDKGHTGKRVREAQFKLSAIERILDILEGVKEQPVKIPKKYMLERETVKNGIEYQKMIAKSAKIMFNNLSTK